MFQMKIFLLLFIGYGYAIIAIYAAEENTNYESIINAGDGGISPSSLEPKIRTKRGFFWDFFQKVGITKNLVVDQFVDTKNTFNDIYNMINEQFSDPAAAKPTTRPTTTTEKTKISSEDEDDSEETTTTTEAYKISRYELGRILGRNFRGLQRVAKLEFNDALNATHYNLREYKAEADKQFANSLAVEKKNKLKGLKQLKFS